MVINKTSRICFEKLFVGLKRIGVFATDQIRQGAYQDLRDYVFTRNNISFSPLIERHCFVLLCQRSMNDRWIVNWKEVIAKVKEMSNCEVMVYGNASSYHVIDQVKLYARANFVIGVSGSALHNMIWMSDNSVLLHIQHPHHDLVALQQQCTYVRPNSVNCSRKIQCVVDNSSETVPKFARNVIVNIESFENEFREALLWNSQQRALKQRALKH